VVYLNVISVTTTLSSVLAVDVDADVDVGDGVGAGSDLPVVGISPAKIEVERAHTSATVIANRFMGFKDSFRCLRKTMSRFLHKRGGNNNAARSKRRREATCEIKLGRFNIAAFSSPHLSKN
jgi:hypothetical protein